MSTEPRMVDVTVIETRIVPIPEPDWCIDPHDGANHFTDLTHNGTPFVAPIVTAHYGPSQIMTAHVSHAPYLSLRPEPFPVLSVELDWHGDLDVADGRNLSRALRLAAVRLDRALDDLARLRGDHR